jgi:predicted HTH transcriptional regulator
VTTLNADTDELLAEPREALDVEVKEWLDLTDNDQRANVAKEIIALANHGGGTLWWGLQSNLMVRSRRQVPVHQT